MKIHKITKAAITLSIVTIISRFFGLFREIFSAKFFGTTFIYDAFLLSFMIPNFFRGLLAEGALNASFIPVFTEYLTDENKKNQIYEIVNICITISLMITFFLFFLVYFFSSFTVKYFSSFSKWFWVFYLLKFTFPYLIFISLSAIFSGILNSYKNFTIPGISPVFFDIFWILSLFFICPLFGKTLNEKILGLCIGIIIGGFFQFLYQFPSIKRRGFNIRLNFNFKHPAIIKMGKLLAPMVIGVAIGPINLLVDYSLANFLSNGMVSGLWYATRLYQLPLGVFGISLSTAVLPWLSENVARKNFEEFNGNLYLSFKLLFLTLIPSTFILIYLREEIITFLFKRGIFDLNSVKLTSFPLLFYSLGIVFYGGISVITRAYYSFNDTKTPVKIGIYSIGTNFILDILLMKFLAHGGIALSTSLVGLINFLLLLYFFNKKHLKIQFLYLLNMFLKIFIFAFIPCLFFKIPILKTLSVFWFLFFSLGIYFIFYILLVFLLTQKDMV